jgi:glycosyltransferase involved in cell wall biosynthesis
MRGNENMRVLVIPSWYPPNGGYFFREHAMALAEQGVKVDVLAGVHTSLKTITLFKLFHAFKTQKNTEGTLNEFQRKYWIIPFFEKLNFAAWTFMMLQFFRWYLKKYGKPDIILAHSSIWAGYVATLISEKHQIPFVVVEHRSRFVYNIPEARSLLKPWYVAFLKMTFDKASKIITVSDSLQGFILDMAPGSNGRHITIPNMVDIEYFIPDNASPSEPFTFFSLGSLERVKGMDILIEAFRLVHEELPGRCRLVIGGQGSQLKNLQQLVSQNNLNNFITFEGQLDRQAVRNNMRKAHVFVLASRYEAFGVVFIEAMSCGLPVIGTISGGPQSFIRESEGMIVPIQCPENLAKAMIQMMKQFRSIDRKAIRNYAISTFSKETIAKQYVNILKEILN